MADTLESIELEIKHSATGAAREIGAVAEAISNLKSALNQSLINKLKDLAEALKSFNDVKNPINVNNVTGNTFNKTVQTVKKASESAAKASEPLSEELQTSIKNADKLAISMHKVKESTADMTGAFADGDENAAWRARERQLNAQTQVEKNTPPVALSASTQEAIKAAKEVDLLQAKLRGLKEALEEAFSKGDASKAYSIRGQIIQTEKALDSANKAAIRAKYGVAEAAKEVEKAQSPLQTLMKSIGRIAFYRAIRSAIKAVTQAFSEGLQAAYAFSSGIEGEGNRFAAAMDSMKIAGSQMKGQLGSAFIGLLAAIEPIVVRILNLITALADAISQIFASFTGTTYLKSIQTPQKWAKAAGGAAKAAKEWKNQLLGFDEINRLNEPSDGGGGGGGTNPLEGFNFEDTPLDDWAKKIHDNLALIELAASGFALALGLILLFSGANIPLGLGLIALGVAGMAHALKEDWSSVDPKIAKAVADVAAVVGGALLAVGALLTFTGANIPLGLGLMLAGAASIATAVAINWKAIPTTVGSVVSEILMILGGALLALGVVIMFATPTFSPLGLGLIVAGAAALAGGVAINWNNMPQSIGDVVSRILIILGGALIVLGIILCLTGAGIPLGIGLIMAGAASLAGAYAINSGAIIQAVQDACNHIWGIVNGLFQGIHDWIQNVLDGISQFLSLSAIADRADKMAADGSIYLQGFASGGFPSDGQLFVANEAGAEMVGSIGGRTAVANNDQIVEGIRQGVFEAVMAANNNGNNNVDVRVYLDSREIKAGQNRLNRAMGVS